MMDPTLYLLCGKVGSGKSYLSKQLATEGVLRFSQDERTLARIQQHRKPDDGYRVATEKILRDAEKEARAEILELALEALGKRVSVVIDDGFWSRSARDHYRSIALNAGAGCILYYLPVEPDEQWRRLEQRNRGDLTLTHFISKEDMEYLNNFFEAPTGEGEVIYMPLLR